MTTEATTPGHRLIGCLETALALPQRDNDTLRLPMLPRSAEALLLWTISRGAGKPVLWIGDGPQTLEMLHQDLRTLAPDEEAVDRRLLYFPPWESMPGSGKPQDPDIVGQRLETLQRLASGRNDVIVTTCVQALMQHTLSAGDLGRLTVSLSLGEGNDLEAVVRRLVENGYRVVPEIEEKGQTSVRGGILDVWTPADMWPVRIEFAGSDIESIRHFDPAGQRSLRRIDRVTLPPAHEKAPADPDGEGAPRTGGTGHLLSYLSEGAVVFWSNRDGIDEHAARHEVAAAEAGGSAEMLRMADLVARIERLDPRTEIETSQEGGAAAGVPDFRPILAVSSGAREALQPDFLEEARRCLLADLRARAGRGQTVLVFFDTPGALEHFRERDAETGAVVGVLSEGFISEAAGLAVVAESDLYGTRKVSGRRYDPQGGRPRPDRVSGPRIVNLEDIEPGDLVVHVQYGIGRYLGLFEILFSGQRQEVLTIEYADGAKLHVPASQAHLLSRYVGVSGSHAKLHRLGSKRWNAEKAAAERSILDYAAQLLETQAQRDLLPGHAFPPDSEWQREFDASFPYRETTDQERAIEEVKRDMQSARPMDRLVCGDAGYGKTEVAMRAAFRAVMGRKQVAVLVPTTVLAQQHFSTFSDRMSAYPVRIDVLSRFCTRQGQRTTLEDIEAGRVDIVIGTHALLQAGIRFKDLGLVIIDEEQRFGVMHKERLKHLRRMVNVMTLTATPIPRTLYLSMMGARDMSLIQTPPMERVAIETLVARDSDRVIRDAILREMDREGQVFYLYNRVMTIEVMAARLRRIVPEARIDIAHGQMAASELAAAMKRFVAGEFDVLLCTTIIESGMDIPRANTILIDRADRFGIADLYQLRGRVGRSSHKAYAYFLLPVHGSIDSDARERLSAMQRYSDLSAGFNLAMRDLEIRGAGNLLGIQQSGHVAAIGFTLYCQLLKRTVATLKKQKLPPVIDVEVKVDFLDLTPAGGAAANSAVIPYDYIEDERLRIGVYRRMAEAATDRALDSLRDELADRFGPLTAPVRRLLAIAGLRVAAHQAGIQRIETREGRVFLTRDGDFISVNGRFPRLSGATPDENLAMLRRLVRGLAR